MKYQKMYKFQFIFFILVILLITYCGKSKTEEKTRVKEPEKSEEVAPKTSSGIPANGWQMPIAVGGGSTPIQNPTQMDWLELGWQSFIALNWPASTTSGAIGGQPNEGLNITSPTAASGPTVWLTYLSKEQVFQPNAANPGTWTAPTLAAPTKEDPETGKMIPVIGGLSKGTAAGVDDEFDEAGTNSPVIDQNGNYVLFEIRLAQAEFTYIANNKYYNADVQKAAFKTTPPTFKSFPDGVENMPPNLPAWAQFGAAEIKASWRILITDPKAPNADIIDRYYTQRVYFKTPDGKTEGPYTVGLVGLHILRLTPGTHTTWFWTSFEQVDNLKIFGTIPNRPSGKPLTPSFNPGPGTQGPTYPMGYSYQPKPIEFGSPLPDNPPVNVSRYTPIPSEVETINAKYQGMLKGTVWQYYQMINTLNPQPNGPSKLPTPPGNDITMNVQGMVNSTMETYTQAQKNSTTGAITAMNCNDCHAFGYPQGAPTNTTEFQVFTFLLGDATSPASTDSTGKKK